MLDQIKTLQADYDKIAKIRKATKDKEKQCQAADQILDQMVKNLPASAVQNAFLNNGIESQKTALDLANKQINDLQNLNGQKNKKIQHDIKKAQSAKKQVEGFTTKYVNVNGNGQAKTMNVKSVMKTAQELIEYLR